MPVGGDRAAGDRGFRETVTDGGASFPSRSGVCGGVEAVGEGSAEGGGAGGGGGGVSGAQTRRAVAEIWTGMCLGRGYLNRS